MEHDVRCLQNMRLMIVEGHALVREGLLSLFWISGDVEALAVGAEDALRMAGQFLPDIVVLDMTLPAGAALRIAESIVALRPTVKLLFLDDEINAGNVKAALKLNAAGYWTKHASFEQIAEAVCTVAAGGMAFCPGVAEFFVLN